jgi:hypothetical protein
LEYAYTLHANIPQIAIDIPITNSLDPRPRFLLFSKERNAAVFASYRALHQEHTAGSGDDNFKWDVMLDGPIPGFRINF